MNPKTINIPIPIQNSHLREHVRQLMEKQEEAIQEKIKKQQMKQKRIKQIEDSFNHWADKKEKQYVSKIEKSHKKKIQSLEAIIKKCKERQQYVKDKQKMHEQEVKREMNQAWKKAEQFNQSLLNHKKSQSRVSDKFITNPHSHQKSHKQINIHKQQKSTTLPHINKSKDVSNQQKQSSSKQKLDNHHIDHIDKMKLNMEQISKSKIQQYGQKLQKIERNRKKRQEKLKKLNNSTEHSRTNYPSKNNEQDHNNSKQKKNRQFTRLKSSRAKDWTNNNKSKKQALFQRQLYEGNKYLQENKVRYMKNILEKNIAQNAIERKLFLQRLRKSTTNTNLQID